MCHISTLLSPLETREEEHSDGHGSAEFYIRATAGTLNSNAKKKKAHTHTHELWNAQTHDSKFQIIIKTPFRAHTSNPKRISKVARSFMKAAVNTRWHKRICNEMLSRFIIIFQTQELNITSSPPHKYERAQKMSQHAHKAEKNPPNC